MDLALNPLQVAFDSKENLVEKLKSPFPCSLTGSYSESLHMDLRIPPCYKLSKPKELKEEMIQKNVPPTVLFYIFYNMPGEKAQLQAAEALEHRGWTYIEEDMRWVRMKAGKEPSFTRFNPETWKEEPFN